VKEELAGANDDCCGCCRANGFEGGALLVPLKLALAEEPPRAPSRVFGVLILRDNVSGVID